MFAYEYKLSCGTEHADSPEDAKQYLLGLALQLGFTVGTVLEGTGFWKNAEGKIIIEPSLVLILSTEDVKHRTAFSLAERYCDWSGEECVLVQHTDLSSGETFSNFVTGAK